MWMEAQFQTQQHFLEDTNLVRVIETMEVLHLDAKVGGAGGEEDRVQQIMVQVVEELQDMQVMK